MKSTLLLLCSLTLSALLTSCATTNADGQRHANDIIRNSDYLYIHYLTTGLDKPPEIKKGKVPSHPDSQRWSRGMAHVRFTVNEKGKTENIRLVDGEGKHFGGNTMYAVRFWRFHPAQKDGTPTACEAEIKILFRGAHFGGVNE